MTAHTTPLLDVRDLVKTFGGLRAVDHLSFTLYPGETVSIIGPNGSGKTTTFNILSGGLRPDSGQVWLDGVRIDGRGAAHAAHQELTRTFQNERVFGNMTVRENVLIGMHIRLSAVRPLKRWHAVPGVSGVAVLAEFLAAVFQPPAVRHEARAINAAVQHELARFGERLLPRQNDYAYSLSYANRRRMEIASALAMQPRILLLDEPTAGMNPTETAEVRDQLLALQAAGQAMVIIEHKLDVVMRLSNRVIVRDSGKVIAEGDPATVQTDERVIEAYVGRRNTVTR